MFSGRFIAIVDAVQGRRAFGSLLPLALASERSMESYIISLVFEVLPRRFSFACLGFGEEIGRCLLEKREEESG